MRLLLDTHVIVWLISDDPRLTSRIRRSIENANEVYWSMASLWEIAIKISQNRPDFQLASGWAEKLPSELLHNGFGEIILAPQHLKAVSMLPFHHRDPFDRLLIATAMTENVIIVSCDEKFTKYPVEILW